jgi:hypothetical protein
MRPGRTAAPLLAGLAVVAGLFLFYFLVYPVRHIGVPLGFDPPWYVWRAELVGAEGIGPLGTNARPGHPILSAVVGSITGLSQLDLSLVLPILLALILALAVGAFCREGLGFGRWEWVVAVGTSGVVLGATPLLGEHLSTTLTLSLVVAAVVFVVRAIGGRPGAVAGVAMLVAAGLAHWDFLAVFEVVLFVAVLLALPSSLEERRRGAPLFRTEAGIVAGVAAGAAAVVGVLIAALRAPVWTAEVGADPVLYARRIRTDVVRLLVPAVAGALGGRVVDALLPVDATDRRVRRFSVRLLNAWTFVALAGIVVGLATLRLPPARFLALLVALPGVVGVAAAVVFVARRFAGRGAWRAAAVSLVALVALATPAGFRWYRYPALLDPQALRQARMADRYLRDLAVGPVVFLVDYEGPSDPYSTLLKERTIRVGLSPQVMADAHVLPGRLDDLLAGRRTPPPDQRTEEITRPYWEDVAPLLSAGRPLVVLESLAGAEFGRARELGAEVASPGVAVLGGPAPGAGVVLEPEVGRSPSWLAGLGWGVVILSLLTVAGWGWTGAILGSGAPLEVVLSIAPTVGAGALILGGFLADGAGVRLAGPGGVITYAIMAALGLSLRLGGGALRRRATAPR